MLLALDVTEPSQVTETIPSAARGVSTGLKNFDDYRIERMLGSGGMGEVYLAEQTSVGRKVAIKVIRAGMDSRLISARFERERRSLARMDHPNIAKVYDAGVTPDGRPYFVMEYVPGTAITDYCNRKRLSTGERLLLLRKTCLAVHHAHQRGVIHRDIKPSNILVMELDGKAHPKVIDFGLAKALEREELEHGQTQYTAHGVLVGTPEYMSPEQAELGDGDLTAATDIYSLGVVLYELIVGVLPFGNVELRQRGYLEVLRMIREEEIPKPAQRLQSLGDEAAFVAEQRRTERKSLLRQVRNDLEWVTMRALEKEPERRYGSASELAADIERYLKREAVTAGPPSLRYRAGKLIRRHRLAAAALLCAMLSLLAGIGVAGVGYMQAVRSRKLAEAESAKANVAAAALHLRQNELELARARLFQVPKDRRAWEWGLLLNQLDNSQGRMYGSPDLSYTPERFRLSVDEKRSTLYWAAGRMLYSRDAQTLDPKWSRLSEDMILDISGNGGWVVYASKGGRSIKRIDRRDCTYPLGKTRYNRFQKHF